MENSLPELEKILRQVVREEMVQLVVGDDYMMTTKEAAAYLRLTKNTLDTYRSEGIGPKYVEGQGVNGKVLYRFGELRNYCNKRTVKTKDKPKKEATK